MVLPNQMGRWMKREHGERYPLGPNSVAAPATVGEKYTLNTTGITYWEGEVDTMDRKPGDLPSKKVNTGRGCIGSFQ